MCSSSVIADHARPVFRFCHNAREEALIQQAIALLEQRIFREGPSLQSPTEVREYLQLKLGGESLEVFAVVFLDARHQTIAFEPMFHGDLSQTSVYPRAVLKRAIDLNCASVILAHNHPTGVVEPSCADRAITQRLKSALALVDIRVLDHFIIGKGVPYSFAEAGLL